MVFIAATTNDDTALFMRQSRDLGLKAQFMANYNGDLSAAARKIAGDALEGMIFTTPFGLSDRVEQMYRAKYNVSARDVNSLGQAAYDCPQILAGTVSQAVKQTNPLTGAGLRKTLGEMKNVTLPGGEQVVFNPDHTVKANIFIKTWKGGQSSTLQTVQPQA